MIHARKRSHSRFHDTTPYHTTPRTTTVNTLTALLLHLGHGHGMIPGTAVSSTGERIAPHRSKHRENVILPAAVLLLYSKHYEVLRVVLLGFQAMIFISYVTRCYNVTSTHNISAIVELPHSRYHITHHPLTTAVQYGEEPGPYYRTRPGIYSSIRRYPSTHVYLLRRTSQCTHRYTAVLLYLSISYTENGTLPVWPPSHLQSTAVGDIRSVNTAANMHFHYLSRCRTVDAHTTAVIPQPGSWARSTTAV